MIPIIEPTSIPIENRVIETPSVDIKNERYIGFLLNLKIPVVIRITLVPDSIEYGV